MIHSITQVKEKGSLYMTDYLRILKNDIILPE